MNNKTFCLLSPSSSPRFKEKLHVGRPNVGDVEMYMSQVRHILNTRYLTNNGPYLKRFETELKKIIGAKHVVCCTNCTVAMEILFRCSDFPKNAEVIVPSFTFVASAHACVVAGLTVRFADCLEDTHCVDPSSVLKLINKNTVAILAVNVWGMPCDDEKLLRIAKDHNLKLFYDSA